MSSSIQAYASLYSQVEIDHYATKKKKIQSSQNHLFDSHEGLDKVGAGRWITIGSEKDEDGGTHGGRAVFIGSDGEMKTGKFAGKTFKEAFGKKSDDAKKDDESKKPALEKPIDNSTPALEFSSKTKPNSEAKEGDQLGLFGEATNAPKPSKVFKPADAGSPTKGKQQGLFDTHGNADQMDLFGDGVMDDELVYKPSKLSDTLLSEAETKDPSLSKKPTFGEFAITPNGKVGFVSGSGGMFSGRVKVHLPDSSFSWEHSDNLRKPSPEEMPKGFTHHRDEFGQQSWRPNEVSEKVWAKLSDDDKRKHLWQKKNRIAKEKKQYSDEKASVARYSAIYLTSSIRDLGLDDYLSLPERYDWNESQHPRHPAGSSMGGQFSGGDSKASSTRSTGVKKDTRLRRLPDLPSRTKNHSLSHSTQSMGMQLRLNDTKRSLSGLMAAAARVATDRAKGQPITDEDIWECVDRERLQRELDAMNKANRESIDAGGVRFDDLCNYNGVIPQNIAERLQGGSRFFDPTKLRGRWHEDPSEEKKQSPSGPSEESKSRLNDDQFRKPDGEASTGVSKRKMNELKERIRSSIADDDNVVEAFAPIVIDAWKQITDEVKQHNSALREITGATAKTLGERFDSAGHSTGASTIQKLSAMVRKARNGDLDPSKKKGFDELVDLFERNYPHMLQGRGEDGLLDILAEGIKSVPDLLDEEVANRAVELAGQSFFESIQEGLHDVNSDANEFEQVPFSWISAATQVSIWRYSHSVKRMNESLHKERYSRSCFTPILAK